MKTQEELLQDILNLKKENPELEIHFCISCEEMTDEYGWVKQKISRVEIDPWFEADERIMTDKDEILEYFENELIERFEDEFYGSDIDEDSITEQAQERYDREVIKAICVYTDFDL